MNRKHRTGDVINERDDKVRERESPSKPDADVPFFNF